MKKTLIGQTFGQWTVLEDSIKENGQKRCLCRCRCGTEKYVLEYALMSGRSCSCGCSPKGKGITDIKGQRFGMLTVEYFTDKRDTKGSAIWHCKCDCGNEVDISYNKLLYTKRNSCGCQKKEHERKLNTFLQHVDGTSMDMLKSKKVPVNNTTGVKGVYYIRGKYMAKIVFQKKQYILGNYDTLEEAAKARKQAELELNSVVLEHYEKWQKRAKKDPEWAETNPIKFTVDKDQKGYLSVNCFPVI